MIEIDSEDFETCEECRKAFDVQNYPEVTLIEFEPRISGTTLNDWACKVQK